MQVTYPEVEETVENEAKVLDFLFHKRAGMRTSLKSSTMGWLDSFKNNYFIDMELVELSVADYIYQYCTQDHRKLMEAVR